MLSLEVECETPTCRNIYFLGRRGTATMIRRLESLVEKELLGDELSVATISAKAKLVRHGDGTYEVTFNMRLLDWDQQHD